MMKDRHGWPVFNSDEWSYSGVRYPWYKFIRRGEDGQSFVSIQYVSCAQYIQFSDDGVVDNCLLCDPLLPSWKDYGNYLN